MVTELYALMLKPIPSGMMRTMIADCTGEYLPWQDYKVRGVSSSSLWLLSRHLTVLPFHVIDDHDQ